MLSSLKLMTVSYIGRQQQKKLSLIITYLIDLPEAAQFIHPVDWQELQLFDYPQIVKHPMNLLKVQDKLKSKEYHTVEQALDEIQLVWDNCKRFNPQGQYYVLADKMERNFKKMIKNYLPNIQVTVPKPIGSRESNPVPQKITPVVPAPQQKSQKPPSRNPQTRMIPSKEVPFQDAPSVQQRNEQPQQPQEVPQSEKNRLQQRLKQLTQQQLAQVVCILQENCAQAFKELGGGRSQMLLDSIDCETFRKMGAKIDQMLQGQKGVKKVKI